MYVDLGLLKPRDIRIARCNRWTDNILQNGNIVWQEIRRPADSASWDGGFAVFTCAMLMANACSPPHIEAYGDKFRKHVTIIRIAVPSRTSKMVGSDTNGYPGYFASKRTNTKSV